jgi:hypothetical protein
MHKKLAADLTSLAHSILQMKNKDDVFALKEKAHEIYEKLSVLAYVEEYINTTPNAEHTKEELLEMIESVEDKVEEQTEEPESQEEVVVHKLDDVEAELEDETEDTVEEKVEEVAEEPEETTAEVEEEEPAILELDVESEVSEEELEIKEEVKVEAAPTEEATKEIEEKALEMIEEVASHVEEEVQEAIESIEEEKKVSSLDEELKDTIAVDVVADLFENATKKSLNDKLHGDIQIGLNDRIAFVKNLFGGSQEDFNRVVSQLNTFKTEKEAKKFINKMVKPDYDWSEKEEYEERFMTIVGRKFA